MHFCMDFCRKLGGPYACNYCRVSSTQDGRGQLYLEIYKKSIENPDEFWGNVAQGIVWDKKFTKVLDTLNPPFTRWQEIMMANNDFVNEEGLIS